MMRKLSKHFFGVANAGVLKCGKSRQYALEIRLRNDLSSFEVPTNDLHELRVRHLNRHEKNPPLSPFVRSLAQEVAQALVSRRLTSRVGPDIIQDPTLFLYISNFIPTSPLNGHLFA